MMEKKMKAMKKTSDLRAAITPRHRTFGYGVRSYLLKEETVVTAKACSLTQRLKRPPAG